jgi:hypothetical protein
MQSFIHQYLGIYGAKNSAKYKCKNYLQVSYQEALKMKKVCSTSILIF